MIDELITGVVRLFSGFVKDFLYDVVYGVVFYTIGWIFIRVVSLGRSPAASLPEGISDSYDTDDDWVSILGGVIVVGIALKLYF